MPRSVVNAIRPGERQSRAPAARRGSTRLLQPAAVVRLSVNVNKFATLRNSRGGVVPDLGRAVDVILAGAHGITVHPRADRRHITPDDVRLVAERLKGLRPRIEYNIEGDLRDEILAMARELRPDQLTLVPVVQGEITSHVGWSPDTPPAAMEAVTREMRALGVRVSVFVEADPAAVGWAARAGAHRIELYTEPYARAFERGDADARASFARYVECAELAHGLGLGVNAGHDLDTANLRLFRTLPHLDEVSIGHALVSDALFVGLDRTVRAYLDALAP
jgi:pyridoxine 5-phosphate synthase